MSQTQRVRSNETRFANGTGMFHGYARYRSGRENSPLARGLTSFAFCELRIWWPPVAICVKTDLEWFGRVAVLSAMVLIRGVFYPNENRIDSGGLNGPDSPEPTS